ncbi:TF2A4 [Auxenochlorella protothecoides x Auxenochlorella symbiontica]|uniref:Transcription initiation factor IIA subunit 2 n=2 Tax=Auxenochlorella protothecoides TaxID=3075 RepID=A0A087SKG1_AUXPR|nr:Transcription initiation factor IIA subunit 2 [Auxenochlorella protothecoides]KFM26215.1 Transcription initiation factor IIA subunit 2 [Auxenochlorella protothecoides]RMZ56861.1 hypothetical protein APUTEX25_002950 [Auxenochlorella protothecoides]|eukprot:RMZ56861.1 hypothetical protein APUTEX25_002950 [Auxenochlorella protothecoides]
MTDALYRSSSIGESLMGALKLLQDDGKISDVLAMRVIQEFDAAILRALDKRVTAKSSFKGQLDTYRYCDNVWDFELRDVILKLSPTQGSSKRDELELAAKHMRLILVDSKVVTAAAGQHAAG